jgi:hypothetical protein
VLSPRTEASQLAVGQLIQRYSPSIQQVRNPAACWAAFVG